MTARVCVLERVVGDIRIAIKLFGICRVGNNGVCLGKPSQRGVVLACAVVVEAEAGFLALARVTESRRRGAAGEARPEGPRTKGFVAGRVPLGRSLGRATDGVGGATQVVA